MTTTRNRVAAVLLVLIVSSGSAACGRVVKEGSEAGFRAIREGIEWVGKRGSNEAAETAAEAGRSGRVLAKPPETSEPSALVGTNYPDSKLIDALNQVDSRRGGVVATLPETPDPSASGAYSDTINEIIDVLKQVDNRRGGVVAKLPETSEPSALVENSDTVSELIDVLNQVGNRVGNRVVSRCAIWWLTGQGLREELRPLCNAVIARQTMTDIPRR